MSAENFRAALDAYRAASNKLALAEKKSTELRYAAAAAEQEAMGAEDVLTQNRVAADLGELPGFDVDAERRRISELERASADHKQHYKALVERIPTLRKAVQQATTRLEGARQNALRPLLDQERDRARQAVEAAYVTYSRFLHLALSCGMEIPTYLRYAEPDSEDSIDGLARRHRLNADFTRYRAGGYAEKTSDDDLLAMLERDTAH